jgi:outer membrane protein assembly factor BamB
MRRILSPVLIGLGAFLVISAVMLRFYALPRLAVAPIDQDSVTTLTAKDAVVFNSNPDVLAEVTTDLTVTSNTIGDVKSSESAPDGVRVWNNTTSVRMADGTVFNRSVERSAFDEKTGANVDCCDTWDSSEEGVETPVTRTGQMYKFPFGTEKKDYQQWDGTLNEATTAKYDGEDEISGIKVYKFVQEIPETTVGTREVPGSLFGSSEPAVQADMVYANVRTIYIEPTTGAPLSRTEEQNQKLVYNGSEITAIQANLGYTKASTDDIADQLNSQVPLLKAMQLLIPLLLLIIGLAAVGVGVLLRTRPQSSSKPRGEQKALADA